MKKISDIKFQLLNKKGFTLIELLIVIVIIGILATFLMVNFVGVRQRARDAQRKSDLRQIQSALEMYRSDNSTYPLVMSNCDSSFTLGETTYMQKIPCDPLSTKDDKTSYTYDSDDLGSTYSLIACLENINDQQKDSVNVAPCNGTNNWSFKLQNP